MLRSAPRRAGLLVLAALVAGCGETPTGRWQLALVPDERMARIGAESFAQIKRSLPVAADPRAGALVRCVSRAIVDVLPSGSPAWEVVVFRDPSPNAFALPGGKIGIHTGILDVAETPGQLAAIIGHEVAHVLADHANERMTQELGVRALLLAVGLFGEGDLQGELLREVLGLGARFGVLLPFSRVHEEEADVLGLRLMARAGFDPRDSLELWRNMARAAGDQPPEFLSTHPSHGSRFETLQAEMAHAVELERAALAERPRPQCAVS